AFYSLGIPVGSLIGLALGGIIADQLGWRAALLITGFPGLILAIVGATAFNDPRRPLAADGAARGESWSAAMAAILQIRSFQLMSVAAGVMALISYGQLAFLGSFFRRVEWRGTRPSQRRDRPTEG